MKAARPTGQKRTKSDSEPLFKMKRTKKDVLHPLNGWSNRRNNADFFDRRIRHGEVVAPGSLLSVGPAGLGEGVATGLEGVEAVGVLV